MMGILPRLKQGEGVAYLAVNQHLTRQALKKTATRVQNTQQRARKSPATAGKGPAAPRKE